MPSPLTYPGVYIEEVPSGVRTITGVPTAVTAFIGRSLRGPANQPVKVQRYQDFTRSFGDLWRESSLGYAVSHFFQHGGGEALIVRVFNGAITSSTATITLPTSSGNLVLEASSPGEWGNALRAIVDHDTRNSGDPLEFNLTIEERDRSGGSTIVSREIFRNVSVDPASSLFVDEVVREASSLVRVRASAPPTERPSATSTGTLVTAGGGQDGSAITGSVIQGNQANRTGIYALDAAEIFNLLCIPPLAPTVDVDTGTWALAAQYCRSRRALLIIDPPASWSANPSTAISTAEAGVNALRAAIGNDSARNAAAYFPQLRIGDPLNEGRVGNFAPSGAVAGILARTDAQRGVWKAPAGLDASFSGVKGFSYVMTDSENGVLNQVGLNSLRSFQVAGNVVWGARTLAGADLLASEWKYLPVRRLALFLEESLYRGTQWVVFEPNDEPLWSQIRLNIGAFMQNLFRQGAFQGRTPREAYIVKCDRETTTQNDINLGMVNILVGFAPLKPAEFVVIRIQQLAGQIAT